MNKYRKTFLITSIITVLPMLAGLFLWNQLPERVATHFASDDTANGWSSRGFAVFGLPLILLAIHAVCVIATSHDPKHQNVSGKVMQIIMWICPVISILGNATIYLTALGYDLNISKYALILVALAIIIIGNYLPKCRQNYTVGIKLPWTLADEDNWNRTHRIAGFLWVICGLLMLVSVFIKIDWLMIVLFLIMTLVPTAYSFLYYRKNHKK